MKEYSSSVNVLNNLFQKALTTLASDIHLEPAKNILRIRFRIDGILCEEPIIDKELGLQVVSRVKVLSQMNVAERRIPQDGKFCIFHENKEIDLRVATFPSLYGEKVVIRILSNQNNKLNLNTLGFSQSVLEKIKSISKNSSGFFLVTGPTGSGKTTTLHAMLQFINNPEKNIITLEDPIEYNVENITQGQIYPDIGFTFERGIRAILRQDPDIIMVGEIRDKETAQVAIQAALTGHLVLSTLHTNDAPGALMRLLDMKIEPFLINASLTGILAQRLARKLCEYCKYECIPKKDERDFINRMALSINKIFKSQGCNECHSLGYKGRIGIFEIVIVTDFLRSLITSRPVFKDIYAQSISDGMVPLIHDASEKVNNGTISLYELVRVLC